MALGALGSFTEALQHPYWSDLGRRWDDLGRAWCDLGRLGVTWGGFGSLRELCGGTPASLYLL